MGSEWWGLSLCPGEHTMSSPKKKPAASSEVICAGLMGCPWMACHVRGGCVMSQQDRTGPCKPLCAVRPVGLFIVVRETLVGGCLWGWCFGGDLNPYPGSPSPGALAAGKRNVNVCAYECIRESLFEAVKAVNAAINRALYVQRSVVLPFSLSHAYHDILYILMLYVFVYVYTQYMFILSYLRLLTYLSLQQFERDLRRFARLERNMLLDNHALFDKTTVCTLTLFFYILFSQFALFCTCMWLIVYSQHVSHI